MNEAPELTEVYFQGQRMPEKPKVRIWHWIGFYLYNFARKPKVWVMQRRLDRIFKTIKQDLSNEVIASLYVRLGTCTDCRNAFMCLRSQFFLSQIRVVLKSMRCDDHPEAFDAFLSIHQPQFDEAMRISAWINGFTQ